MSTDTDHLNILAVFHFVVAALVALVACFPLLHFAIGLAMYTGNLPDTDAEARPIGLVLMIVASVLILCGWACAVALAFSGRNILRRQHHTYCVVMAGLACMFMPFGTVLGVFTIIVLLRDSVKELFAVRPASSRPIAALSTAG